MMQQGHYQLTVIGLLTLALILVIDIPARVAIPKLQELNEYQNQELVKLRGQLETVSTQSERPDERMCTPSQLVHVPYTEWFKASVQQVGGFEPYSVLLNLERIDTKVNFAQPFAMPGVDLNDDSGVETLERFASAYCDDFARMWKESGFDELSEDRHIVDLAVLYARIRDLKPARVLEVGSGVTSYVIAAALADAYAPQAGGRGGRRGAAEGGSSRGGSVRRGAQGGGGVSAPTYMIVDDTPSSVYIAKAEALLERLSGIERGSGRGGGGAAGVGEGASGVGGGSGSGTLKPGLHVFAQRADDAMVDRWAVFESLAAGDVVVTDTQRTFRLDGDGIYVLLNLIPRLPAGVHVSFHETYLPYHYPRDLIVNRRLMWTEQYFLNLLLATSQDAFAVTIPTYYLWTKNSTAPFGACGVDGDAVVAPWDDRSGAHSGGYGLLPTAVGGAGGRRGVGGVGSVLDDGLVERVVGMFHRKRPRAAAAAEGAAGEAGSSGPMTTAMEVNEAVERPVRRRPSSFWIEKLSQSDDEDDSSFAGPHAEECVYRKPGSWLHPAPPSERSKCVFAL